MERNKVYEAIDSEREYQDALWLPFTRRMVYVYRGLR